MSNKIYTNGTGKVLARNTTSPYFCDRCPCNQEPATGQLFVDYISYNLEGHLRKLAYEWPGYYYKFQGILEPYDQQKMYQLNSAWRPSAVMNPQTNFYSSFASWGRDQVIYRTSPVTESGNVYLLDIPLYKQTSWWVGTETIVSGNSSSAVIDNYNLSTCQTTIELNSQSSGFISSIIINNADNTFEAKDFITVSSLFKYPLSSDSNDYCPMIYTGYNSWDGEVIYIPIEGKCQTSFTYYTARMYKGNQESYVFTTVEPSLYGTGFGVVLAEDQFVMGGVDNPILPNSTQYFYIHNHGNSVLYLKKIGNKFFGYSLQDQKTIVEYTSQQAQSALISTDTTEYHYDYLDMAFTLSTGYDDGNNIIYKKFYIYKAPRWGVLRAASYHMFLDNYIVTGSSWDNLRCWHEEDPYPADGYVPDVQMTIHQGYYTPVYQGNRFNAVQSGANYWYVETIDDVPLTGGDVRNPQKSIASDNPDRPPYWWFNNGGEQPNQQQDRVNQYWGDISSGKYIYLPYEYTEPEGELDQYKSIGVIIPLYYDSVYGHLINSYCPFDINDIGGVLDDYYLQAKQMINDFAYSKMIPFVKYIQYRQNYKGDSDANPTIAQYFANYFVDQEFSHSGLIFDQFFSDTYEDYLADWGGNEVTGPDYEYFTKTQRFEKLTQAEIDNSYIVPTDRDHAIDKSLSAALPLMESIHCQILTGFWLRKKEQGNDVCGIRKHGYFFDDLEFNTDYKFGYDLTTVNDLNALLGSDTSICYTRSGSNIVAVQVKDYWASISAGLQSSALLKNANIANFYSLCHIRPISANFSAPQP